MTDLPRQSSAAMGRFAAGIVAACSAGLAVWLAAHHPLSSAAAVLAAAVVAVLAFSQKRWWPWLLLPLVPWLGLMPWTGWVVVEELDILVLALAAGLWMRLALKHSTSSSASSPYAWLWLLPFAALTFVSMARGVSDAGGLVWGWWQGYSEPLNSLRLAKPVVAVLLLWPAWGRGWRRGTAQIWSDAVLCLLLGVALTVIVERLAFTDLLNFSSDYRATGLFWEMHVGGAALDAVLALTLPFAIAGLVRAKSLLRWCLTALVLVLGTYAALATFSRIVYLAVPLGLAAWALLHYINSSLDREGHREGHREGAPAPGQLGVALAALGAYAALALWGFGSSGYRGQLALVAAVALALSGARVFRGLTAAERRRGALAGIGVSLLVAAAAWWLPKGAYVAYGLCWLVAMAGVVRSEVGPARPPGRWGEVAWAFFLGVNTALVAVGVEWSEGSAWASSVAAACVLVAAVALAVRSRTPAWPESRRWQGNLLGAMVATSIVVGVFGGGSYMGDRFTASTQDGQGRLAHWKRALDVLKGDEWIFGRGLGRYFSSHTLTGLESDLTGDYRLLPPKSGQSGQALVLTSGQHEQSFGEIFRFSQRISVPLPGAVKLRLRVLAAQRVGLHVEICEKQLLYADRCLIAQQELEPANDVWQTVNMTMNGAAVSRGSWYSLRPITFSIGLGSRNSRVEVDDLQLVDSQGQDLLRNGDFEQGLQRWFFSSDRHHLPWHAKNLAVHVLFEQGFAGLAAFGLVIAVALWRVSCGAARGHPLAPPLAAAILSLLVVGLVDSLFDMPRVAFLTLLLLAVAMALPVQHAHRRRQHTPTAARTSGTTQAGV